MQVGRLFADGPLIQSWMHDRSGLPLMKDFHGIGWKGDDGTILAAFGFDSFQATGCAMHLCTDISLPRELVIRAFTVPFWQWNYQHLFAIIQRTNAKSLNMATRLGYVESGGTPDLWLGVMKREDCRWLKLAEQLNERRRRTNPEST